jgi:site-specific DNA recombinase
MLNESGVRTKRGCLWSQTSVCRLLSNELYIGRVINGRQEVSDFLTGKRTLRDERDWFITERPDLAIVDPGLFERANSAMRERGQAFRERRERHSSRHLFSTLIKCRECGRSFRRTVRTYRRTFVRWVCSGRNLNGTRFCANSVAVDEDELIDTLNNYFAGILRSRKNVTKYIAGEFDRLCSGRDENARCLRELRGRLARLKSTRQKYMNMYTDDLISREELNAKLGSMKKESARLESDIRLSQLNSTKGGQLGEILQNTFGTIEKFADVRSMTNAQLRQVLRGIEVDRDGHVDIYLRPAGDMQPGDSVLIRDGRT